VTLVEELSKNACFRGTLGASFFHSKRTPGRSGMKAPAAFFVNRIDETSGGWPFQPPFLYAARFLIRAKKTAISVR